MNSNATTQRQQTAAVLRLHFPEYVTGFCLCGAEVETLVRWADHVAEVLHPDG